MTSHDRLEDLVNYRWLVGLRWLLIGCAAGLFLAVQLAFGGLPIDRLVALTACAALSNAALVQLTGRPFVRTRAFVTAVLVADVGWLTFVLASTGGAHNPFAVLYLFEVMVAALVLPPLHVAAVGLTGGLAYGTLFWYMPPEHDMHQMERHLIGMWVAYGVAAPFVAYAVHHLRRGLADADRQVHEARGRMERTERLASLATLAAGAAHEIANPLATIAVVASELARTGDPRVAEDGRLVQQEVERCREVLQQLSAQVGAGAGETSRWTTVKELLVEVSARPEARVDVADIPPDVAASPIHVPQRLLVQALRRLIVNAREASGELPVLLRASRVEDRVRIEVVDQGAGMDPVHLARVGEPFFTTKPRGMGLGLYFARTVVDSCGGTLQLSSEPGKGTVASLTLPVAS